MSKILYLLYDSLVSNKVSNYCCICYKKMIGRNSNKNNNNVNIRNNDSNGISNGINTCISNSNKISEDDNNSESNNGTGNIYTKLLKSRIIKGMKSNTNNYNYNYINSTRNFIRKKTIPQKLQTFFYIFAIVSITELIYIMLAKTPKKTHTPDVFDFLPSVPPPSYKPLPDDNVGIPNVVYGCGSSTPRQIDSIQIHVIGWRRDKSLNTLLQQLKTANYTGYNKEIPFFVYLDGGSTDQVKTVTSNFIWDYGPYNVKINYGDNKGLRSMWFESLGPAAKIAGNNTLMIVFEDDIRVSAQYFQWLLLMIDTYTTNPNCRDANLMGFSLSPIKLQEMTKPFKKWDARTALKERYDNTTQHLSYLSVVPSSWGAAYWTDRWNEFDTFVKKRTKKPFYDFEKEKEKVKDYSDLKMSPKYLHLPNNARCNVWPKSWKRFMVDFMFARGMVMLYPNLPNQMGLATALQEDGEHVGNATSKNPRVAELWPDNNTIHELYNYGEIPRYGDLAVFELFLKLSTREEISSMGAKFLGKLYKKCLHCRKLIEVWAPSGSKPADHAIRNTPKICVADLYTPASVANNRPEPLRRKYKYLLFEPQYGANNQLHALIEAYYWARALNRRLVVPPMFMPRVSAFQNKTDYKFLSSMKNIFKISDRDKKIDLFKNKKIVFDKPSIETISYTDFVHSKLYPWRIIRLTRDAVFDSPSRILTNAMDLNNITLINLRHIFEKKASVGTVRRLLGGCDDNVLAFDGMYFAKLSGIDPRQLMPDVMSLSPEVEELYSIVKNKIEDELGTTDYACYHVRLGDFAEMCHMLASPDDHWDVMKKVPTPYIQTAKEFSCSVSHDELIDAVTQIQLPSFIMSDSPEELRDTVENRLPYKSLTSAWVTNAVKDAITMTTSYDNATDYDLQLLTLIVDQEVCASAKFAILNRFSTVSQRVISLRRGKNYEYWRLDGLKLKSQKR